MSNSGSGTVTIEGNTNYITYSGGLALNRPTTLGGEATDRYGVSGRISGPVGTLTIDAPRVTFDQSAANANTFTGSVVINPGRILQLNSVNGLSGSHSVAANGALYLNVGTGSTATIGTLSGAGLVSPHPNMAGLQTLSVGGDNGSGTFGGALANGGGTLALLKTGTGRQTLTGNNTFTGPTTVSAGTLALGSAGSIAASPAVAVAAGATFDVTAKAGGYAVPSGQTLSGNGTVAGSVTLGAGATLSPGASPGVITVTGNATLGAAGNYNWQVFDATGTAGGTAGWDLLTVGGALDLTNLSSSNRFNINLWSLSGISPDSNGLALNFDPNANGNWTILSAAGGISGFSSDLFQINGDPFNGTGGFANSLSTGWGFSIQQDGNNLNLVYSVPEPSTYAMALAGIACGGFSMWRRRKRA